MTDTPPRAPGTIITFYSYKGGTGRSMALANVAWILASNGYRVLAVDWDLEAPGLHRYFAPFMIDPDLVDSEGVIDMVSNYVTASLTPPSDQADAAQANGSESKWYEPFANVLRYATSLDWSFPEHEGRKGWLDLIPAGRQGPAYAIRMNSFSWQNFYDRLGGGGFIEALKKRMKEEYDFILIDSRTGVSDTSGICTVQLPDTLAVCFTLNRQSIEGAGAVASSVYTQRRDGADGNAVRIFAIPTRVEKAEKEKLDLAREAAKDQFGSVMPQLTDAEAGEYWGHVEVFYEPYYAYEEILATFGDKPLQTTSLLASMERITAWLTNRRATQLIPASEADRQRVLGKYARQSRKARAAKSAAASSDADLLFYFSYATSDLDEYLERFFDDLTEEVKMLTGRRSNDSVGFVDLQLARGSDWSQELPGFLRRSRVLVSAYSPAYFNSEHTGKEFQYFLDRAEGGNEPLGILPVVWVNSSAAVPRIAASIQYRESAFPESYNKLDLRSLMRLRRYADDYRALVSLLAQRLVSLADRPLRTPPTVASFNDMPSAFGSAHATPTPADASSEQPDIPETLRTFAKSIPRLDRQDVLDVCEGELRTHLRTRAQPYPLHDALDILRQLSRRRFFDLMELVADDMIQGGQDSGAIQRQYARSLVYQNKMTAALAVLQALASQGDPVERAEVMGLLGQAYKQLYVEANEPSLPRNQQNLIRAIRSYRSAYDVDRDRMWHGINVAALSLRAARDKVTLADTRPPTEVADVIAHEVLNRVEFLVSNGDAAAWHYSVAVEACLALDQPDATLKWLASYIQEPDIDAFELSSLLRQLTEVWQLDLVAGIGSEILPILRAELLKREGSALTLSATDVLSASAAPPPSPSLEKVFGSATFLSLRSYQTGLERCGAVGRIESMDGALYGTGFLLSGADLGLNVWESYFVTASHLFNSPANESDGALAATDAVISFEILGVKDARIVDVVFSSPPTELDTIIARLSLHIKPPVPYPIAKRRPVANGSSRLFMIGYPSGSLAFSMNDNVLLDQDDVRLHYRAPAEGGSSGSPIFNENWNLIGMHHAGGTIPRLNGRSGTYEANEGIWIDAIRSAVSAPVR